MFVILDLSGGPRIFGEFQSINDAVKSINDDTAKDMGADEYTVSVVTSADKLSASVAVTWDCGNNSSRMMILQLTKDGYASRR